MVREERICSPAGRASTVARYITYLSKPGDGAKARKPATIVRRLTSINRMHKIEKFDSPASLNNNPG